MNGAARPWTPDEARRLRAMKKAGRNSDFIATQLPGRTRMAIQTRWSLMQQIDDEAAAPSVRGQHARDIALEQARAARIGAREPRSLTAAICGDPPPGRSALDRINERKGKVISLAEIRHGATLDEASLR
jgi:hypothetical protein